MIVLLDEWSDLRSTLSLKPVRKETTGIALQKGRSKMRHVERKLLLKLASKESEEGRAGEIEAILRGGDEIDWDHLLECATRHKVVSLCFHNLRPHIDRMLNEGSISEGCVSYMREQYEKVERRNAEGLAQVARMGRGLDEQGIKFVLLKGLTLAQTVYSPHAALRRFGDIDILVAPEDARAATAVFRTLGYVQGTYNRERDTIIAFPKRMLEDTNRLHMPTFVKKDYLNVDVHTRLEVPSSPFELPTHDMFSRAQSLYLTPDLRVMALSVEDGLLHLCVHLSTEAQLYYPNIQRGIDLQLIKFCDIRGYILYYRDRLDWTKAEHLVHAYGLQDPVFYALYHCNTLYSMAEVERFLSKIAPKDTSYLDEFQTRLYQSARYRWKTVDFKERMFSTERNLEAKQILLENRVETGRVNCPKVAGRHRAPTSDAGEEGLIRISESDVPDWQPFGTHLQSGVPPEDDRDLSARCRMAWNERYLHLDIEVKDDVVLCMEDDGLGDHLSRDCVRAYFASFDLSEDPMVCIMFPTTRRGPNLAFVERNRRTGDCEAIRGSEVMCELDQAGYKLQVKLPFGKLGIEPDVGREVLFDLEIEDCDTPGEGIKSTIVWSGGSGRNLYDRSVYGILQFVC